MASGTSVLATKGAPMGTTGASSRVPPRGLPYALPEVLSVASLTGRRRVQTAPSFKPRPGLAGDQFKRGYPVGGEVLQGLFREVGGGVRVRDLSSAPGGDDDAHGLYGTLCGLSDRRGTAGGRNSRAQPRGL